MCGIVGFITQEENIGATGRRKFFLSALIADSLRGTDGTGAFFVRHKQEGVADWCKQGSHVYDLLDSKLGMERMNQDFGKFRAVIGHNRAATVGKSSTANAHPFQEGPITLVHNGTLHVTSTLPIGKSDLKGVDVDSHVIAHNLAEHPAEEVISKLSGAFALIWHDARDNSVNIVRNSDRPLHLLRAKCERTLLIASEAEMLGWLARRNNFKIGDIFYPQAGHYLKFMPDGGVDPIATKVDLYSWGRSRTGGGHRGAGYYYDADWWDSQIDKNTQADTTKEGPNMGKGRRAARQTTQDRPPAEWKKAMARQANLPKLLKRQLRMINLDPLDKLRFRVDSLVPIHGSRYVNVTGALVDINRVGMIAGLDGTVMPKDVTGETWTVAPIAERRGLGGNVLLARLLSRSANFKNEDQTQTAPSSTSSPTQGSGYTDPAMSEGDDLFEDKEFYDWDNNVVPYDKWLALTQGGCLFCKNLINPLDAPEITWDQETKRAVCPSCSADLADFEENSVCLGS